MTLQGTIQNGVVVLDRATDLPEGTPVTVFVTPPQTAAPREQLERMSEVERLRVLAIIDRIASLPLEGSDEPFSGADHDKVLYPER